MNIKLEEMIYLFCPKCKYEYVKNLTRCPDCDVDLVEELTPDEDVITLEYNELITVFESLNPVDIAIGKSMLEDENIPYYAKNEAICSSFTGLGFATIELQVCAKDVEAALLILKDLR